MPAVFSAAIQRTLNGLNQTWNYIDDIIVAGRDFGDFVKHLRITHELKFLGFIINSHGIRPDPTKVETLKRLQRPYNKKELQRFLGLLGYHRRFQENPWNSTVMRAT
eukprot:GHVO01043888.1.p1 GENE.GHVO01043888.1~~GHVO01043888.1.p1  ORF type:complete len:107 (-),score=6.47 GHVO01043888.1:368-688(-)